MKHRTAGSSLRPAVEAARTHARAAGAVARRPAVSPAPPEEPEPPVVTAAPPPTVQVGNWELRQDAAGSLVAVWVPTGATRVLAIAPLIRK